MFIRREKRGDLWIRYEFPYSLRSKYFGNSQFWRPHDHGAIQTDIGHRHHIPDIFGIDSKLAQLTTRLRQFSEGRAEIDRVEYDGADALDIRFSISYTSEHCIELDQIIRTTFRLETR